MADENSWRDLLGGGRFARLALIWFGVWLNAADALVTVTLMPSVGADLGGYTLFGWTIAGFMVGAILANASAGRVAEVIGLRPATVVAGIVFAAGCAIGALAPSMEIFVAGRVVQGLGSGWISGFAMVAIARLFPARHLGRVFAATAGVWGVATLLGPLVGGVFANGGEWRTVFWLFAGQALLFTLAAPILLKGVGRDEHAPGIPWRQLGVLSLAIGAVAAGNVVAAPVLALALVTVGLALLVLMLRWDARARVRMLPLRSGDPRTTVGAGYLMLFLTTAASMPLSVYGPSILQQLDGLSPLAAGYAIAAEAVLWSGIALTVAGVNPPDDKIRIRWGAALVLIGVALQLAVFHTAIVPLVIVAAGAMGVGFGLSMALSSRRILAALDDADRAIGSSAIMAVRQTGGAVGAGIAGVAANLAGFGAGLTDATARAVAVWPFAAALPLAAIGAWAAWRMTAPTAPD